MIKEIDYSHLFYSSNYEAKTRITMPSGRTIEMVSTFEEVGIFDPTDEYYCMNATNSKGVLELTLFTNKNGVRHPEMYARSFIAFALKYFERTGEMVTKCRGSWLEKQDNYADFIKVYTLTHNLVTAAKSTWSGKTFMSFGFTEISARDIVLIPEDHRRKIPSAYVVAMFSKPETR